ncbi:MAG: hypothetical protein JXB39_02915 [Deltaproteobacteria bacterium]|nr:hypothetical protein [Deltaproteobacteria bacterium]
MTHAFLLHLHSPEPRPFAPTLAARRALASIVLDVGDSWGILGFRASGSNLRILAACGRPDAGRLAQATAVALRRTLGLPRLGRTRLEAVSDGLPDRLRSILADPGDRDPFHDASALPDLVGLRVLGDGARARAGTLAPGIGRDAWLALLGVPDLQPSDDPAFLADGAAAAVGLPDLASNLPRAVAARRAVVAIAWPRLGLPEVADLLAVTRRAAHNYRSDGAHPALVEAVRLQAGLRVALFR